MRVLWMGRVAGAARVNGASRSAGGNLRGIASLRALSHPALPALRCTDPGHGSTIHDSRSPNHSARLPIESVIPELKQALAEQGLAVVHAPPGAGKTTLAPLSLLGEPWLGSQRILLLEPRRLAARAAARRMSQLHGDPLGQTVGYRTRLDSRISKATRIEVVTEGILTRIVQDDPTLDGYGLVIFDEFHERSLQADVGLALVLHSRGLVRPELRIAAMSATMDGTAVARLLGDAPVITSLGQQFPVETRYRPRVLRAAGSGHGAGVEAAVAATVRAALEEERGDVLVFLPGAPEIHRVHGLLVEAGLPTEVDVIPLHGALGPGEQDRAILPSPAGLRKVVLSTSIAETSLTIEGVRVVVDSGLARRQRFSPRTGMSRLETIPVSRAAADQRRGRAGRIEPGICYRIWEEGADAALIPFAPAEITESDLAPLVLDLAVAGIANPADLRWLDAPPAAAWGQALDLLRQLQAIDERGFATPHGRGMSRLGMHPRLAHMVFRSLSENRGALACELAALLSERDPLRAMARDTGSDVVTRLQALRAASEMGTNFDRAALSRIGEQSRRWRRQLLVPDSSPDFDEVGRVIALAYPDRVARRRPGQQPRYLLRNGTGAFLPESDSLGSAEFIVIAESDGRAPEARVFLAAALSRSDVEEDFSDQVAEVELVEWDHERGIRATRHRKLGAIILSSAALREASPEAVAIAVEGAVRRSGLGVLPWDDRAMFLRARLAFLHHYDQRWPEMSDSALTEALLDNLKEALGAVRSAGDLRRIDVSEALMRTLTSEQRVRLDRVAPTHFVAPTGSRIPIDYSDPAFPVAAIRLQEMFGCSTTPALLDGRVPVTLHLLSPARRPVQVTRDLIGFWKSSYFAVRKDLRARYPKHAWPDDPLAALPTTRTTRR